MPDDGTGKILTLCLVGILFLVVALIGLCCYKRELAEEREAEAQRADMRRRVPRLATYDTEEIHRNCTVVVWIETTTGETVTQWWPNDQEEDVKL